MKCQNTKIIKKAANYLGTKTKWKLKWSEILETNKHSLGSWLGTNPGGAQLRTALITKIKRIGMLIKS